MTTEGTAESILQKLQTVLREAEGDTAAAGQTRAALRTFERTHGAQATRYGRLLHDLVTGSYAWDLFEEPSPKAKSRLPRIHELCVCEPLLQIMRESGELAARERLLKQRDSDLATLWRQTDLTEEGRWQATETAHDTYFASVAETTEIYRAHYETLRQAAGGRAAPLVGPRVRSRPLLQPPLMALLFHACHQGDTEEPDESTFQQGGNAIQFLPPPAAPLTGRDADADEAALQAWADRNTNTSLAPLDPMAWDLAALAVSAFYVRTDGNNFDASFPLLIEDYFQWRGVDPRKRSKELRGEIAARLELLCSDRMQVRSETSLWLTDPATGRRAKTPVAAEGTFLVKRSRFFRRLSPSGDSKEALPETAGYLLSLGEWARTFVEERAMLGIYLKRLAEYDLQRQQWERRIGWYLVFQLNNQASKMTFQDVTKDGKTRTSITPQHPLKMKTVLNGSHVPWKETARTNPGKVIKQWEDALETLRKDGILGPYPCLDGAADGSDLPVRGRLTAMLERRYQFVPGRDLLPHLRAKRGAAERKRVG
jgi:hypothetical protein